MRPAHQSPRNTRIVAILGVLMITIAAVTFGGTKLLQLVRATTTTKDSAERSAGDRAIFYSSLGATPADASQAASDAAEIAPQYTIEVKIAKSRDEAEAELRRLANLGITAYYTPLQRQGRVVYRVRRGVFKELPDAELAAREMTTNLKVSAKVVRLQ